MNQPELYRVIARVGSIRRTTVELMAILGDIVTTPRDMWTNADRQAIIHAFSGVAEVVNVPGEYVINARFMPFQSEIQDEMDVNPAFLHAMF